MNLVEQLTEAIKNEMTGVFQFVPSHGRPYDIEINKDGKIASIDLTSWDISYDEKLKRHTLVLKKDNDVISFCSLTSEGAWKGRDRVLGGFLLLRPPILSRSRWQLLANPIKFYKSFTIDDKEEDFHYREPLSRQFDWKPFELDLAKEINKKELVQSQTAIALIASDRLDYFERTVQSIAQNEIAHSMPIFGFFDKSLEPKQNNLVNEQVKIFKDCFQNGVVIKRPRNFGCGRNIIDARRQLFDNLDYRRVFIFEDDMIISPTYMQYVVNLFNWANENYTNIGAVQGWAWCDLNVEDKTRFQNVIKATYTNWWGYCMSKKAWDSIKSNVYTYEKLFLGGEYKYRPHESIRHWFRLKLSKLKNTVGTKLFVEHPELVKERKNYFSSPPTGQDAVTMHLFEQAGWLRLCPVANRGLYIGKNGIHMNAKLWASQGFDGISYDLLSGDENIKDFVLYQDRDITEQDEEDRMDVELTGLKYVDRR